MMYQSLLVAILASTVVASPQHNHRHQHIRRSGSGIVTGTGSPYSLANSTAGPYANSTSTVSKTITVESVDSDAVTVTVSPLAASGSSTGSAADEAAATTTDSACGASQSTTTLTSIEYVTVTVSGDSTTSSAAVSSSSVVAVSSSSSSTAADVAGAFYAASSSASSSSSSLTTSYSTSYVAESSSSAASSSAAASTTVAESTTSASTSTSASSSSTSSSSSSSKRGLAYNDESLLELFESTDLSWAYNWADSSDGTVPSQFEYIPLFWCTGKVSLDDWLSAAESAISDGSEHVLSMNEPDESSQCDITASAAAAAHIEYMNPLADKAKIGSPAVTNGGGDMGLTYMENFFTACDGECDIDFMVIHWYSSYYDGVADDFKTHVTNATDIATANGISETWITEFALDDASTDETVAFLESVLPWLDDQSTVGRYAFYMCADGLLTSGSAISSEIGEAYISS